MKNGDADPFFVEIYIQGKKLWAVDTRLEAILAVKTTNNAIAAVADELGLKIVTSGEDVGEEDEGL